ncbi:AP2 domain transcription factor APVIIb-1/ADA2-B, partial [Cardiosporidium cionae]
MKSITAESSEHSSSKRQRRTSTEPEIFVNVELPSVEKSSESSTQESSASFLFSSSLSCTSFPSFFSASSNYTKSSPAEFAPPHTEHALIQEDHVMSGLLSSTEPLETPKAPLSPPCYSNGSLMQAHNASFLSLPSYSDCLYGSLPSSFIDDGLKASADRLSSPEFSTHSSYKVEASTEKSLTRDNRDILAMEDQPSDSFTGSIETAASSHIAADAECPTIADVLGTPFTDDAQQRPQETIQNVELFSTNALSTLTHPSIVKMEESGEQFDLVHYHCDICSKDITFSCRIKCAECEDFDLCVYCFCGGAETSNEKKKHHKNYHQYIPIGKNVFPLYKSDWSADEEIMLLEGISKFGLGNWNEVADLVNTVAIKPKRSNMCERHYFDSYLNSRTAPLPDSSKLLKSSDGGPAILCDDTENAEDEKSEPSQPKVGGNGRSMFSKPTHQVVGYWPLRGDFDVEYDNDAELILADMEFKDYETAQERHLKLQIIEIYNSKLDERIYRKKTVIERGLLDVKALQQKEKKRTKEERELHNLFRPLARFHSEEEHERFVQLLIEEKLIRARLQKLQEWKSLGLKTIEEVREYEEEKRRRKELKTRGIAFPYVMENSQRVPRRSRFGGRFDDAETKNRTVQTNQPVSILQFPGAKLLDENERSFCESIGLPPVFYLLAKKILLHEAESNGHFRKEDFTKILRIGILRSDLFIETLLLSFVFLF